VLNKFIYFSTLIFIEYIAESTVLSRIDQINNVRD
jgi:hypothetical protein